jgi:hypothetical protein
MQEALKSMGLQCDVSICGLSGHRADEMLAEIDSPACRDIVGKVGKGLRYILDKEGPFDLVILMAGTNDFTPNCNLKTIKDVVCQLHSACHARGVPTLMLAAPCNAQEMRIQLGRLLREWANKNPAKVLGFVDPEDAIPRSKAVYWEPDQVHFTPTGSRALGAHLAPIVAQILRTPGQKSPMPALAPRASGMPAKNMYQRPVNQPRHPMMVAPVAMMHMIHRGGA